MRFNSIEQLENLFHAKQAMGTLTSQDLLELAQGVNRFAHREANRLKAQQQQKAGAPTAEKQSFALGSLPKESVNTLQEAQNLGDQIVSALKQKREKQQAQLARDMTPSNIHHIRNQRKAQEGKRILPELTKRDIDRHLQMSRYTGKTKKVPTTYGTGSLVMFANWNGSYWKVYSEGTSQGKSYHATQCKASDLLSKSEMEDIARHYHTVCYCSCRQYFSSSKSHSFINS